MINRQEYGLQRSPHLLDICRCGDYRKDHKDGEGICIFTTGSRKDGHFGAGRCDAFLLSKPFTGEGNDTDKGKT